MAEQVSLNELRGKTLRVLVAHDGTNELILEDEFGQEYEIEGYDGAFINVFRR